MGSLEDLWDKRKQWASSSPNQIASWLSNDGQHGSSSSYLSVANKLASPYELEEQIVIETDATQLIALRKTVKSLPISGAGEDLGLLDLIDENLKRANREDRLAEVFALSSEVRSARDIDELKSVRRQATRLKRDEPDLADEVDDIIDEVDDRIDLLKEREEISKEELRRKLDSENEEERREALRAAKAVKGRKGGISAGERLKGLRALVTVARFASGDITPLT